jgi:hypothetical protein
MTSRSPSPPSLPSSAPPEPEQDPDVAAELPMTMAASVVLDHLPKDATRALETAGEVEVAKGKQIIKTNFLFLFGSSRINICLLRLCSFTLS